MTDYYTCDDCGGQALYCGCYKRPTIKKGLIVPAAAITDIAHERARQITAENWTREHDDHHTKGELARAAACYAVGEMIHDAATDGPVWPWPEDQWKPATRRRELVKAAALIVAEIERLDRTLEPKP